MKVNVAKLITMGWGTSRPEKIGILSLTEREDIRQFIQDHQQPGKIDLCEKILEFKDLDEYKPPKEWNAVILLHSVKLGRLSLTDVHNAKYDKLLKNLHDDQGKKISNRVLFFLPYYRYVTSYMQ